MHYLRLVASDNYALHFALKWRFVAVATTFLQRFALICANNLATYIYTYLLRATQVTAHTWLCLLFFGSPPSSYHRRTALALNLFSFPFLFVPVLLFDLHFFFGAHSHTSCTLQPFPFSVFVSCPSCSAYLPPPSPLPRWHSALARPVTWFLCGAQCTGRACDFSSRRTFIPACIKNPHTLYLALRRLSTAFFLHHATFPLAFPAISVTRCF